MPDEFPDFDLYAELEVSERASAETIAAAFRSLQLRNHPDRVGGGGAGDRAVRLNIARDWLIDPERRARYDAHLAAQRRIGRDGATGATRERAAEPGPDRGRTVRDPQDDGSNVVTSLAQRFRIDVRRLGRIWIAGLGFVGAVALVPGAVESVVARLVIAGSVTLLLVAVALGGLPSGGDGMSALAVRWTSVLLGWLALAVLAVEGVVALVNLAPGGTVPGGVADAALPALAVAVLLSVFAVRRRAGPISATIDDFLEMTPRQFETAVGDVLRRRGYRLEVTGGPGDLVADLAGTDPEGRPTIVQCKRYAPGHPVGSRDVQLLIAMGVRHHKAERLVLVTTSDFTDPALDLADEHGVTLITGEELEDMTR